MKQKPYLFVVNNCFVKNSGAAPPIGGIIKGSHTPVMNENFIGLLKHLCRYYIPIIAGNFNFDSNVYLIKN